MCNSMQSNQIMVQIMVARASLASKHDMGVSVIFGCQAHAWSNDL